MPEAFTASSNAQHLFTLMDKYDTARKTLYAAGAAAIATPTSGEVVGKLTTVMKAHAEYGFPIEAIVAIVVAFLPILFGDLAPELMRIIEQIVPLIIGLFS